MADDKCLVNPQQDCYGLKRAEEVAGDVKALDQRLSIFQNGMQDTINKFGGRIGKLEAHNEVQDEQVKQIKETQAEIKKEVEEARKEQKDSIAELRREHKESMEELKRSNKEILDAVTPMKHKVESLERLEGEVENIKSKPGKNWEELKGKIVWGIVGVLVTALGAGIIRLLTMGV